MARTRLAVGTALLVTAAMADQQAWAVPALRTQVDQRGNFLLIGNTLGYDCGAGVPEPAVGTVGACGLLFTGDSSPDIYWRSQSPTAGEAEAHTGIDMEDARSTAVLELPPGATVTHARLYWSARTGDGDADTTVTLDRPSGFSQAITADESIQGAGNTYQSTADITALVQAQGEGAYRTSGVDSLNFVSRNENVNYAAWWIVLFYEDFTQPPRNLTLFDGLDEVAPGQPQSAALSGFLVPAAGFDAQLGVVTYEGDDQSDGDFLRFGPGTLTAADELSDALNPIDNFFNGTRSFLGSAVSVAGDLPQLTGEPRSMGGFDLDTIDVTSRVSAGQTSANIAADSDEDIYYLAAFVTSISTFRPDFAGSEKVVTDVNGGSTLPGDELEYTINVVNSGNDVATDLVLTDPLPIGVTYVPNSLEVVSGSGAGMRTDAAGDDAAEYDAGSRTVTFWLGTGADASQGGTLGIGASTAVRFRVSVDPTASGLIENQAEISATGEQGAPTSNWPTDGNGSGSGTPPTPVVVDECAADADCSAAAPRCDTAQSPHQCVECLTEADCGGTTPVCVAATGTCEPCAGDGDCAAPTGACQPSGACGECSESDDAACTGATPVCNVTEGECVECVGDGDCGGATPICNIATGVCTGCATDADCGGATPACQPSGGCGECSESNDSACTGATPVCDPNPGTCVGCGDASDCGGDTPVCDVVNGPCVECLSDADCDGLMPTCDPSTNTCTCVPAGAEECGNGIDDDCNGEVDEECQDSDGDGLPDTVEDALGTDPNDADSDDDGVPDGDEPDYDQDTDGDGLINALDPDSDDDGLFDGTELGRDCSDPATDLEAGACVPDADPSSQTDPLTADTDGGGATDGSEDANLNGAVDSGESDPAVGSEADDAAVVDSDGDGLSDDLETFLGSDPLDGDSDDDGLLDGQEHNPSHDTDGDGLVNVLDVDSDDDALYDGTEAGRDCSDPATDVSLEHCIADADPSSVTSNLLRDTDDGGVIDGSEDSNRNGQVDAGETDPTAGNGADDGTVVDTDGDGLGDDLEDTLGSDSNDPDSDDDGLLDGEERNPGDDGDGDGILNVNDPDSDDDRLFDGTEAGRDCSDLATDTGSNQCRPDADDTTTTGVLQPDTDRGGVPDGVEDSNQDGAVDVGETDPNDPADDCAADAGCVPRDGGVAVDAGDGGALIDGGTSRDARVPPDGSRDSGVGGSDAGGSGGMMTGGTGGGLTGGAGGAAGSGAVDGGVMAGGASGSMAADGSAEAAGAAYTLEGGGCACSMGRAQSSNRVVFLLLGAAGLLFSRRRSRRFWG